MLMYGYVAKWKSRFVGWVALLSIIGEFVALSGVVGGSYVRLSAFFIFGMIGFVAWALMLNSDMMEEVRPVPDEFYKPLGAFNTTVRGVAPHVVEVETDSGAILFADADRVPEVACFPGSRVQVDAAVVVSPAGQGEVRADGVGVAMLLRVMGRWNNLVAAAEYELPLGSGVERFMSVVVCALIDGAIAYGLYNLSQWVGEASPWWYAARFFMAHVMFSAGATLFAATCDLDPTEGGKMRKALR